MHSFAGLADEYYAAEVAYNEFYPKGVEPLEPNITAALDRTHIKWGDLISPRIAVPTEYGKDSIEALQEENRKLSEGMKKGRQGEQTVTDSSAGEKIAANNARIEQLKASFANLKESVGLFEGAGYASKGLYRSMIECLMISSPRDEFCAVCRSGIERMLTYYTTP